MAYFTNISSCNISSKFHISKEELQEEGGILLQLSAVTV